MWYSSLPNLLVVAFCRQPRILARFCLLVGVAIARCIYVAIEQPRSSDAQNEVLPSLRDTTQRTTALELLQLAGVSTISYNTCCGVIQLPPLLHALAMQKSQPPNPSPGRVTWHALERTRPSPRRSLEQCHILSCHNCALHPGKQDRQTCVT